MVDSHGMHLGGQFTSACPAEVKLTESTPGTVPDDIPIICLVADCTYDSDTLRDRLVYLGIDLNLPVHFPKKLTVKVDLKVEINPSQHLSHRSLKSCVRNWLRLFEFGQRRLTPIRRFNLPWPPANLMGR